jgi:hypothetical protein
VSTTESPAHIELKRLALIWAQANGYLAIESERRGMNLVRTPRTIGVAITATARRLLSVGSAKRQ